MKKSLLAVTTALILVFSSACGVDTPSSSSDLDLTVTARDPSYDFSNAKTYVLPDTVQVIQDPNNSSANATINTSLNSFVINQVATQLNNLGYQRLTDTSGAKPDVFVQISAMATTNTEVYYSGWYGYWGTYYNSWYSPGFSVGYAPYPSGYVVTTTIGSLIVNMTNPNQPDASTQKIPSLWVAVVNGALNGSDSTDIQNRIQSGLNEAFSQSPYLKGASQ